MVLVTTGNSPAFAHGFAALCVRPERVDAFRPDRIHELASFTAHRDTGSVAVVLSISRSVCPSGKKW
jgi:hypothetical protein